VSTVYSLIAWGGLTGKTVTLTIASPCVVTSTDHGLRDGTGLRFKSNSDTLPTGLTADVTYYAKSTAANTFNLYSDAALTTIINTSGSQSGTHILRSLLVADPASALAPYGLSDLSRWGTSGSERVYDGLVSWNTGRSGAGAFDAEVAELGMAFTEVLATVFAPTVPSAVIQIISTVNEVRTGAYHAGVINSGYILYRTLGNNTPTSDIPYRGIFDGFTIQNANGGYNPHGISMTVPATARKMVVLGNMSWGSTGIENRGSNAIVEYCLVSGWTYGFIVTYGIANQTIQNCIATKNYYGFYGVGSNQSVVCFNNISFGNQISDYTGLSGTGYSAGYNMAETDGMGGYLHGAPWASGSNPSYSISTADALNFGGTNWAATDDFSPAASTSPQVDAGVNYYLRSLYDLADQEAPAYNNGGAEGVDIGCYEFDLGYGPHPASTTVTFTGVYAGSEIRVYNAAGTELAGVESCDANHALTWNVDATALTVRIVKEADKWYQNP